MQSVSSRIWTRVSVSISYDDNHYTTGTSKASLIGTLLIILTYYNSAVVLDSPDDTYCSFFFTSVFYNTLP